MTAAATLASLERLGPQRLTDLAAREGVTQPAMTQLITRLEEAGLARREASPDDGRVVLVAITERAGRRWPPGAGPHGERLGADPGRAQPGAPRRARRRAARARRARQRSPRDDPPGYRPRTEQHACTGSTARDAPH